MYNAVLTVVIAGLLSSAYAIKANKEVLRAPATFYSPNYPQPYPNNQIYVWEINAERGIQILLQFKQFSIEYANNCTKDAVTIYDWKGENYEEVARLCGTNLPPVYKSTNYKLKVVLVTNNEVNLSGFQAMWTATCGGMFTVTEKEQFLYSPGFPYYWPNMSCDYTIKVPRGKKGFFKFLKFDLEGEEIYSNTCYRDYLKLESDDTYLSHKINERHCGKKGIPDNYFDEYLDVHFQSNEAIQGSGFEMAFSFYSCGGKITEPTIITASRLKRYPNSVTCTWNIEAPENKKVLVKFPYLNLNVAALCGKYQDYIKLYDGLSSAPEKQLAAICGNTNAPMIFPATGNTMTFEFHSNKEGKGFLSEIVFADAESVGCGGEINMTYFTSFTLKSPQLKFSNSGDQIDCIWNILAPENHVLKVKFTSFSFPDCNKKSNESYLEIRDGIVPDSLVLGSYCGDSLPKETVSSSNRLSIRTYSIASSEFTATLTVEKSICKPTIIKVSHNVTRFQTLGYKSGSVPRGINCAYEFQASFDPIYVVIRNLDLQAGTKPSICDKDKIVLGQRSSQNMLGKNYTSMNNELFYVHADSLFRKYYIYENVNFTHQYELCGSHNVVELYLSKNFILNLITSTESVSRSYKGFEIEAVVPMFCSYRNFSEPYGRITNQFGDGTPNNCYTLITAPEGYTISVYFISYAPYFTESSNVEYIDIYDGATTASKKITSTKGQIFKPYDVVQPVFSTGRYLLLHSIRTMYRVAIFDLNYMITNQGRGCGGYLFGDQGMAASPMYPDWYSEDDICDWEFETPPGTRLLLSFKEFDVYGDCDVSYVKVIDRNGKEIKTWCNDVKPEDYISADNYVRLETLTTADTSAGSRWIALFASVSPN